MNHFCCSIYNILHNTHSVFFFANQGILEIIQNIETQFGQKTYLFYPSYVAKNYRGNTGRHNFNHC